MRLARGSINLRITKIYHGTAERFISQGWLTPPFSISAKNGYSYDRSKYITRSTAFSSSPSNRMVLTIRRKDDCRWDAVSLGEVMLRLDPGERRIHTARTF